MAKLLHPLLLLLARATEPELVRTIEYLKTEDRILRGKLPKRITVTPAERSRLVKLGKKLGAAIKEIFTIVQRRAAGIFFAATGRTPAQAPLIHRTLMVDSVP